MRYPPVPSFAVSVMASLVIGCAAITQVGLPSPEAQLVTGARLVTAGHVTGTTLLRERKIGVNEATSYERMLTTAGEALKGADRDLVACRKETGSNEKTSPDPCWAKVGDVITIALDSITKIKRTLDSK